MRPNSKNLALRDPALATLMGAIDGADFGDDYGDDWGDDYGDDYGDEYGDDWGDDYGWSPDFGAYEFGAAPASARALPAAMRRGVAIARPVAPPPAVAAKLWAGARKAKAITNARRRMLEPNHGSKVKVERYSFAINAALVLGTPSGINTTGAPDTNIRPQRVTMNAPAPGFITVNDVKVANVSVLVGGIADAFEYSPLGVGMTLDMPTLTPANRATMSGAYTGFVPPGFVLGSAYTFVTSFKGPASIIA